MPTLISQDGFDIRMYFDEYELPHVHAFNSGGRAKITIGNSLTVPTLIQVQEMNAKEAKKAIGIVLEHQTQLLTKWREYRE